MLFDLQSGRRKTVVKVVYSILALLMGGSLVLFGIGSDAPGGILDALGLGGDDSSSEPQYEQQIDDANAALQTDPNNQQALLDLVRYEFLSAQTGITTNFETGAVEITEDARTDLEDTAAAWERYLRIDPPNPDVGAATNAALAYRYLNDAGGAAGAQEVVADDQGTAAAYGQLAFYLYADFNFKEGDRAAENAVAAADPSERADVRKNLEQIAEQARKQQKLVEQQAEEGGPDAGEEQLSDPFGALGGGSTDPGLSAPTPAP